MITAFPFRLGDAPALAGRARSDGSVRLVVTYTRLRRDGVGSAAWRIDGALAIHAATLPTWPRANLLTDLVAGLDRHFAPDPEAYELYVYAGQEILPSPSLCALETAYLDAISEHPGLFTDDSPVPGPVANPVTGHAAWSPSDYAARLVDARAPDWGEDA